MEVYVPCNATIQTFSAKHIPAATVENCGVVRLETKDCFSNHLRTGIWFPTKEESENPATGPVYVKGVRPGMMLRIDVLEINLWEYGVIESVPERGPLGKHIETAQARLVPIQNGEAHLSKELRIPLQPMIGVLGVAPAEKDPMTMLPGNHGGNMDCSRIGVGSTVFLPVFVEGALLAVGDLHAVMGDGEIGVSGLEIPGSVTLRLTAENRFYLPFPIVFNEDRVHAVASAETLDESCEKASENLYQFIVQVGGVPAEDAVALMTIAADLHVCQMVNPLRTACMSIPFKYCPMIRKIGDRVFFANLK